jgi:hypothetical protein
MSTNFLTPGCKILRCLMAGRGWATLSAICLRTHGKKTFQDAKKELEGLILVREERPWRKRRYRTRNVVYLTAKGWAACATMNPKWTPTRLAPEELKTWLRELQNERDPWAMSLHEMDPKAYWKMVEDARKLTELRATNRIRPHSPKKMGSPKAIPGVTPEALKPHLFQPNAPTGYSRDRHQRRQPDPAYGAVEAVATPARTFADDLRAVQDSKLAGIGEPSRTVRNLPKPADAADDARILARFNTVPFPGELQPDGKTVMFGGRLYSLKGWETAYFKQSE